VAFLLQDATDKLGQAAFVFDYEYVHAAVIVDAVY
jgi:hypothetical protein